MKLPAKVFTLLLFGASCALISDFAAAQTAQPGAAGAGGAPTAPDGTSILIDAAQRVILERYFQHQLNLYRSPNSGSEIPTQGNTKPAKNSDSGKSSHKSKVKKIPPGLARKGELPPGIVKQLERNRALPPGLAYRSLPTDLARQVSPPSGAKYVLVGDRVILVQAATNVVLDMLEIAAAEILE